MDIVYACFERRPGAPWAGPGESTQALDVLWAHARADDLLEHAHAAPADERLDLLLLLRASRPPGPGSEQRVAALLRRAHRASPLLRRRYLPPTHVGNRVGRAP